MDGNILILDYSEFEREKIKFMLKNMGVTNVKFIPSIDEYYTQMDSLKDISLIIMDIAFPNESEGFEILGLLKKGPCKDVPVIIATRSEKLEYRDRAAKMGVNDYVVKPYTVDRLESSIRSFIKIENKFHYDTEGISDIIMSFEHFIEGQLYLAEATKQPLSIMVITVSGSNDTNMINVEHHQKKKELACKLAINAIKPMLSPSDMIIQNQTREILIVLPLTDSSFARLCKEKVVETVGMELGKAGEKYTDYFYTVCVTYPEEGKDLQALMKSAYSKITNKDFYEGAENITEDTKKYANKLYTRYSKWF